jgi:hypothetical protein
MFATVVETFGVIVIIDTSMRRQLINWLKQRLGLYFFLLDFEVIDSKLHKILF